ncbi:alkaline shock response membrane anchor protein AmaP [Listeria sp. PSOL-1]|uniref:alkaline shock response membrane anchor protein AmaP n=1 Tax=Listeria sp. PSOL-1 TaxID=1844999 RepID=UPI0013D32E10|nr:alkaline shock response membrane anchor protein AmaP [Listeria sp. PSOL-1]
MNGFVRLIFLLIGLVGMIGSAIFAALVYPLAGFSDQIQTYSSSNWFMNVMIVVAVLIFFVFFLLFFAAIATKQKVRALHILTPAGDIQLTQTMINSTILHAIHEMNILKQPEVYTKLNSKKQSVQATISGGTIPLSHLPEAGKNLQANVEERLKELLQIEHVSVDIRMEERIPEKRKKNEARVV